MGQIHMVQSFDESVDKITAALRKVAGNATERCIRDLALEYIAFLERYRKPSLGQAKLHVLAYLSQGATRNADQQDWQDVLVHAYELLSALPGDPGSVPRKPPRPPWGRK
jgi:hypothetical protein